MFLQPGQECPLRRCPPVPTGMVTYGGFRYRLEGIHIPGHGAEKFLIQCRGRVFRQLINPLLDGDFRCYRRRLGCAITRVFIVDGRCIDHGRRGGVIIGNNDLFLHFLGNRGVIGRYVDCVYLFYRVGDLSCLRRFLFLDFLGHSLHHNRQIIFRPFFLSNRDNGAHRALRL